MEPGLFVIRCESHLEQALVQLVDDRLELQVVIIQDWSA